MVRTVVRALGLKVPKSLARPGRIAACGILETKDIVDVHNPSDESISHTRPDLFIRINSRQQIFVLDVTRLWEGGLVKKETEVPGTGSRPGGTVGL